MKVYEEPKITSFNLFVIIFSGALAVTGTYQVIKAKKIYKDKYNALEAVWYEIN